MNIEKVMSKGDPLPRGSVIHFKNGRFLQGDIFEAEYIGQLVTKKKAPYIILKGRGCAQCDKEISLYIHSPDDGDIQPDAVQRRFNFPGKLIGEKGQVLQESRAFLGDCLASVPNAVVWYQVQGGSKTLRAVSVGQEDQLVGESFIKNLPDIKDTLAKVKENNCREIRGIDQVQHHN